MISFYHILTKSNRGLLVKGQQPGPAAPYLPGLPPVPCLLTCCVLAVPVILLAFGTLSGLELTVIVGRLWRDLIYNANRRPFQRRD